MSTGGNSSKTINTILEIKRAETPRFLPFRCVMPFGHPVALIIKSHWISFAGLTAPLGNDERSRIIDY